MGKLFIPHSEARLIPLLRGLPTCISFAFFYNIWQTLDKIGILLFLIFGGRLMAATIKVTLHQSFGNDNRAIVILRGPNGESANHEFQLLWVDGKEWSAVFWSLKLYSQDERTWPKSATTISKAEEMGLFVDKWPSEERLRVIGEALYEKVFGGEKIRSLFSRLLLPSDELHVVEFHIPDVGSRLHAYPWELLHDGHDFLFGSRRAFLVRHVDFDQPIPTTSLNSALQVLLIDPRPDLSSAGYPTLPLLDREYLEALANQYPEQLAVSKLTDAFRSPPTLSQLHRHFLTSGTPPQILHIDAHGHFGWLCRCGHLNSSGRKSCKRCDLPRPKKQETRGYLAFQDNKGKATWISGDQLGRLLDKRGVLVAVLAACKSGQVGGSSPFNSIAGALIKRGIPAVIAMQFAIDTKAAATFIEIFYTALIFDKPLTEAVAEARTALLALSDDSWYRPVLYLRTDPANYRGEIFSSKPAKETVRPAVVKSPRPESTSPYTNTMQIESPQGTMLLDSPFYIERQADRDCWRYLKQGQAVTIFVQAPRQVGKSSLMRRMAYRVKEALGIKTVFIDFEKFTEQLLEDEEKFLIELCFMIGDALDIPEAIDRYWGSRRRSNLIKCSNYLSRHIIRTYNKPFILAMEEVERLLDKPMRNNFFGMLRTWHNDRAWDRTYAKMSLFLSSSTEPHLFIDNPNQSPFNVAQPIRLHDFTLPEVAELNRRHESPLNQAQLSALVDLLGGHPFLTRLALYKLATDGYDFDTLRTNATSDTGPFAQHLRHFWQKILDMPQIKPSLSQICRHQRHPEDKQYYRLKGAGLIKKVGSQVVMQNNLYARYFTERLNE